MNNNRSISKLSIITVVFNDHAGLEKTIASVIEQRNYFASIEYLVIDGGSTDGTVKVLEKYKNAIDKCVSERDDGIYHAMNKGIQLATGDALVFMNAGDYFVGNVLGPLDKAPAFLPVKYVDMFGRFGSKTVSSEKLTIPHCHQGIVFENKGVTYDQHYNIAADYKYFLDHGYTSKIEVLRCTGHVFYDAVGVSATKIHERDRQIFKIRREKFGFPTAVVYECLPFLKRVVRRCMGK